MKAKVLKFQPTSIGDDYRFDADEVLELAKGGGFVTLAIIAEYEDGSLYVSGNANGGELLMLIERAKHRLIFPED